MSSSERVVYTPRDRRERRRGAIRMAYLPAKREPVIFGVDSEMAEHEKVPSRALPPHATTLEYVLAAAGWLTRSFGGELGARQLDASDGALTADVTGEVGTAGGVLTIRRINVAMRLITSEARRISVVRTHSIYGTHCPPHRTPHKAIQPTSSCEVFAPPQASE